MNKLNLLLNAIILLTLSACGSQTSTSGPKTNNTANIPVECATVPAGAALTSYGCPGASGTWTRYTVTYSNGSNTSSGDVYCGGDVSEVPTSQANFDSVALSDPNMMSNHDFVLKETCASGTTFENTGSGSTTHYLIWNKH